MSNPNALLLLADHIKLSLLERQRAKALKIESDSQDGHISRSLDQFRDGLEALQRQHQDGDVKPAALSSTLASLRQQLDDLTTQFHGFSSPSTAATLILPNNPSLAPDFAHATSTTAASKPPPNLNKPQPKPPTSKTVRFSDSPLDPEAQRHPRSQSFPSRYSDDPAAKVPSPAAAAAALAGLPPPSYGESTRYTADGTPVAALDNMQIHAYHQRILDDQDAQLDVLSSSISRQRELGLQIGDELDEHVLMLEESERVADRHASRLDRAKRQVSSVLARGAGENRQVLIIVALIVILVLLIAILK